MKDNKRKSSHILGMCAAVAMAFPTALWAEDETPVYEESDCVREQPEGELRTYVRYGEKIEAAMGGTVKDIQAGLNLDVVFAPDGKTIWFHNILASSLDCNSWVKGEIKDDKVVIPSGQLMTFMDYGSYYNAPRLMMLEENKEAAENSYDRYTCTDRDIVLTYEDGVFRLPEGSVIGLERNSSDPVVIDLEMNGLWLGYADLGSTYYPLEDVPAVFPTSGVETWSVKYNSGFGDEYFTGHTLEIAIENDNVYIKGLFGPDLPEYVIKGHMEGDKVRFQSGQYLGVLDMNWGEIYHVFSYAAEYDNFSETFKLLSEDMEFSFNKEGKTLSYNGYILFNRGTENVLYGVNIINPSFTAYTEKAAVPAKPGIAVNEYYTPYVDDENPGYISVYLPCEDVNGDFIDPSLMSFRFFIDGEQVTFYPDRYSALEEPVNEIPYGFSDGSFIYGFADGLWLMAYFKENVEEFGVCSVYRCGGKENVSEMAVYRPDGSSVETISDSSDIVSVEYFDISGQRVSTDYNGLAIRRTTYSDGTVKSEKVMNK